MGPRDHTIHLGNGKSPELPPQIPFITKVCFLGHPNWTRGTERRLQNLSLGAQQQKMRAENTCRTPPSELHMEPYNTSYGRRETLWRVPSEYWYMLRGQILFTNGELLFSKRGILLSKREHPLSKKEHVVFKKGTPVSKKGCHFLIPISHFPSLICFAPFPFPNSFKIPSNVLQSSIKVPSKIHQSINVPSMFHQNSFRRSS